MKYKLNIIATAIAAVLISPGCSSDDDENESSNVGRQLSLVGPVWTWTGYREVSSSDATTISDDPVYNIRFSSSDNNESGSYTGFASCNDYSGRWVSDGVVLETIRGGMTDAVCNDATTAGLDFFGTLDMAADFSIENDQLSILSSNGSEIIFTGSNEEE